MIFSGDIACPNLDQLPIINMPNVLRHKVWVSNLEGAIELDQNKYIQEMVVFNNYEAIKEIKKNFNLQGVGLANNHITDTSSIIETKKNLDDLEIKYFGAGETIAKAKKTCVIVDENNIEVVILNFGWRSISCIEAEQNKQGVNSYNKKNILNQFNIARGVYPNAKIVAYFHWNYELELYPQPFDRELSYELIDRGIDAVIGCHAAKGGHR